MSMKSRFFKITLLFMLLMLSFMPVRAEAQGAERGEKQTCSQSMKQFQNEFRKLWIDHTIWTRNYVISAFANLEDQEKTLARLLRNQQDIGNAIKPYYGEEAGNKLTELLKENIVIAGKIVDATKKADQAALEKNNKDWVRNADDIAQFLSSANPNLPLKELKDLLHVHLQLLTDVINARSKKDWDADILAFDKGEDHIIVMADTISKGIIKQFPKNFK